GGWYSNAPGHPTAMLLTQSGGSLTAIDAPLPPDAETRPGYAESQVLGISCPSVSECVAGGWYTDTSLGWEGLLLTSSGGSWTPMAAPVPSDAGSEPSPEVDVVSCPSVSECVAVGAYVDTSGNWQLMLLAWSGGAWTATKAPLPGDALINGEPIVTGVSCPS